MAISVLQEKATDTSASGTTLGLAFTSNVTSGSSIHVAQTSDTDNSITPTDTLSNTFSASALDDINDTTHGQFNVHWLCNGSGSGADTVTVKQSANAGFRGNCIREIGGTSGADSGKHSGRFQANPGTSANAINASSGGVTPSSQPGLLSAFCIAGASDSTLTQGNDVAYTAGLAAASNWTVTGGICTESYRYTSTSALNGSFTDATNGGAASYSTLMQFFVETVAGPTINTQPTNQYVYLGQTATFTVSATTSGGALSYQWQQFISGSWSNVGTNSSSYTTGALGFSDNGDVFRVQVTDSNGTVNSNIAFAYVTGTASLAWVTH